MEEEKISVLTLIDENKKCIYKTLDKMEELLKKQEDMCSTQEEFILKSLTNNNQQNDMQSEDQSLEQIQSQSVQLLENIYYLIQKVDKNFDSIINNLPKSSQSSLFKKNNELDLIVNKLLLDSLNENLESCGQVIEDSKYLANVQSK